MPEPHPPSDMSAPCELAARRGLWETVLFRSRRSGILPLKGTPVAPGGLGRAISAFPT